MRGRFYLITASVILVLFVSAAALFEYQNLNFVRMDITGTTDATFTVAHDSTSVPIPANQSVTVELPTHTT